jgi:hypothetical protein
LDKGATLTGGICNRFLVLMLSRLRGNVLNDAASNNTHYRSVSHRLRRQLTGGTRFFFTFELASLVPASARLFYDIGKGLNEKDSETVAVKPPPPGSFEKFEFELPKIPIPEFRLDVQLSSARGRVSCFSDAQAAQPTMDTLCRSGVRDLMHLREHSPLMTSFNSILHPLGFIWLAFPFLDSRFSRTSMGLRRGFIVSLDMHRRRPRYSECREESVQTNGGITRRIF